jgi:serine/threonine protein kinase
MAQPTGWAGGRMTEQLLLNDRYRLLEQLATGGMGEVWRAADQLLARLVAVKILRREFASDDAARSRFQAEARFAASLHHSGIAQVFDYGRQDDVIYLVMELVDGEPLSKIISRTGGLDPEATLDLVAQSARALQVAHTAGIIHRDIKPGNLMVTGDGTIKVTDFGIARAAAVSTLTQTGMVMGTAHYVSPEQASGQSITPATDLYSLGVVAFECLTGEPPFDADTPVGIALQHVRELPPELPSHVPGPVRELVHRLLAKDPAERPGSAQELADEAFAIREALISGAGGFEQTAGYAAVAAFDHGQQTRAQGIPPEFTEPAGPDTFASEETFANERRRSPLLLASVAMGLLLLGAIVIGSLWPDPQGAGRTGNDTKAPASTASPGDGPMDPSPMEPAPPVYETSPTPSPQSEGTTAPPPSTSPTVRVTVTPTRTRPATPRPTPTKTIPTPTEPTPPDPDPSSSAGPAQDS